MTILNQRSLNVLKRNIEAQPDLWSTFDNTDAMNKFLESVIQAGNNQDVQFNRECIKFVEVVFPLSSNAIRRCILASPIMQSIYGLLSSLGRSAGFEEIISFAEEIQEWGDLQSGLILFGDKFLDYNSFSTLAAQINERELADFVKSNLLTEVLLDSFLSNRENWIDWDSAMEIIKKFPNSLNYNCFSNAAMRQSEDSIHNLSEINGVDRRLFRRVVLNKGEINNWGYVLDYIAQEIILSSDAIFQRIAVNQSCQDLYIYYDNGYIEGKDLKDIIDQKGYWDDWDSVTRLRQENILNVEEEQIILTTLNTNSDNSIMNRILGDRDLLSRVIDRWGSNRPLCPNFPSLCWTPLLDRFKQNDNASGQTDTFLIQEIASITDEIELKAFFVKLYALKGDTPVYCHLDALKQGKLISHQFIEEYKTITEASSFLSLSAIAAIRKKYNTDINLVQAANKLGLFSSPEESITASMARDFSNDDKAIGDKYNERYFNQLDKNAKFDLGLFYESYKKLNNEQKLAVLTDEDSCLVISSAGSGKTRVIVSKYEYLTQVKGVDPNAIRILAYTKATRKEINEKLGLDPQKGPARTFHSFANEIIESSGKHPVFLNDVQTEADGNDIDHSEREASLFNIMKNDGIEQNQDFMNALSLYAVTYKKYPNRNLSFYEDRNKKIGSLKSYQEKVIFDFLAENSVDFAYEEESSDGKARPDFTIYCDGEIKCYYEHFAIDLNEAFSPYGNTYLQNAKKKIADWGDMLIYTKGAGVHDSNIILEQLKRKLEEKGITLTPITPEKRTEIFRKKKEYVQIFQSGIRMCLNVYDIIRETTLSIDKAFSKCKGDAYANKFMSVLFKTAIEYYTKLLKAEERIIDYTGLIEYAFELCNNGTIKEIPWNYILIDEYQDISPLRYQFIKSLKKVNPKLKICAVGDDWQSIYSFANSDLTRFNGFEKDWPYSRKMMMTETFRFNDPLLSVSSSFLSSGKDPLLVDKEVRASDSTPNETNIEAIGCNDFFHQINMIQRIIKEKKITPANCLILARYKLDVQSMKQRFSNSFSNSDCFMTMHASKGLTRDYVFLVNCNSTTIPSQVEDDKVIKLIRGASNDAKLYEERRLFYVAITRARIKTFVLYSGMPSIFVNELSEFIPRF